MKTLRILTLLGILASVSAPAAEETPASTTPSAEATSALATGAEIVTAALAGAVTNAPVLLPNGEPGLQMNFREAPLDQVLKYLSEAAGFIIVLDTKVTGKINAWSDQPLSKDEAVNLLNSVLNRNGYAAIRHGRSLTIVNKDEAKTRDIPVILESDPDKIPKTDEIVTQIMPVRFIEVAQLLKDLQPLVATSSTITANEAGNSIIMTDTRANINRVAQIIRAIDQGAEDVTEVRVFQLQFADPTEMATLLASLFPDESRSGGSQSPVQFGGRSSRGGGNPFERMFGGGNTGGGNSQDQRIKRRAKVVAVPDPRTSTVIVTATSGLMSQVEEMIKQLDADPARKQKVFVYQVNPGDVSQVQTVLKDMFETTTGNNRNNRNNSSQQNDVLRNRATQNQNTTGGGSSFGGGNTRGGGNRNTGGGF